MFILLLGGVIMVSGQSVSTVHQSYVIGDGLFDHGLVFSQIPILAPDTTAPIITNVNATSISSSRATIVWDTDELANSSVNFGTNTSLGTIVPSGSLVTSHSVLLTGLTNNTLHFYNVTSCDASGNCATEGNFNFTTTQPTTGGAGGPQWPTFVGLTVLLSVFGLLNLSNSFGFNEENKLQNSLVSGLKTYLITLSLLIMMGGMLMIPSMIDASIDSTDTTAITQIQNIGNTFYQVGIFVLSPFLLFMLLILLHNAFNTIKESIQKKGGNG